MILTTNAIRPPVALSPKGKNRQKFIVFFYEMRRSGLRLIRVGSNMKMCRYYPARRYVVSKYLYSTQAYKTISC